MKIAYFDCFAGISGDMILGALVHLGVPPDLLEEKIRNLPLDPFRLEISAASRMGIHGKQVKVLVEENSASPRKYSDISMMIENGSLPDGAKAISLDVFKRLAEVEGAIHGCPKEDVHFHELGGVDAIVDVVGAALCVDWLGLSAVCASEIPLGKGFVNCRHGRLPIPAPATVSLLRGVPVYGTNVSNELVTPTGAAILTSLSKAFGPMPGMVVQQVGYGVGERDIEEMPNLLRVVIGDLLPALEADAVTIVETNIDDMNPEIFGFVMERLFDDGALDVSWIPIFMKKNRPGTLVRVLCREADRDTVVRRILSETTATGVRHYQVGRVKLHRSVRTAMTSFGTVHVKEVSDPGGEVHVVPEYEDCRRIALERNLPLKSVYDKILKET